MPDKLQKVKYTGTDTVFLPGEVTGIKYPFLPGREMYIDLRDVVFWLGADLEIA